MNRQDQRAVRLQASVIRGQIEYLTDAAKHSETQYDRIMSTVKVLESVANVIEAFVPAETQPARVTLAGTARLA